MKQEEIKNHNDLCEQKKAELPKGPWTEEPNRLNWVFKGLDCMLVRQPLMLQWCGYVGVPKDHPYFGKGYSEIKDKIDVHGGLTYASECRHYICHDGDNEVWWFGFDCAQAQDLVPSLVNLDQSILNFNKEGIYKDIEYVRAETNSLAAQLAAQMEMS